ncbi:hypothetical protein [Butyrivibrio sp. VCB2001]|uniref:hypothetical protein n=1 Tax=Butyrivibrio sp. VCB2001 TaxID=1280667 RepID=UPI00047BAE88|nr:hypothetical protein [Butyrivibrio sp. VCB2001]
MKKKTFCIFNIIFPLLVGAVIYWFTSTDVIFVEAVRSIWGMSIHIGIGNIDGGLAWLVRYYMSDILWAYALVFALYLAVGSNAARVKTAFVIAVVFSTVMEVIQLSPVIPGTFDVIDILVEATAEAIAALIIKKQYEEASNI